MSDPFLRRYLQVTAFKAKPDSGPAPVKSLSACAQDRSQLRIDFWPLLQQVGGWRGVWRRLGAECELISTAPGSPLLLQDFFLTWNFHMTKKKETSPRSHGAISIY